MNGPGRKRASVIGSFRCPVCGWRFYRDRALQGHIAGFHPDYSPSDHRVPQAPTGRADVSPASGPRMRRRWRVLAGIGAFLWIPVMVLVFVALGSVDQDAEEIPAVATIATLLFIPAWVAAFAAIVLMVRHVYTETDLSIGWKTAWTALLFLLNVLVAPIYFLRHMATSSAPAESPGWDPTVAGSRSSTDR